LLPTRVTRAKPAPIFFHSTVKPVVSGAKEKVQRGIKERKGSDYHFRAVHAQESPVGKVRKKMVKRRDNAIDPGNMSMFFNSAV